MEYGILNQNVNVSTFELAQESVNFVILCPFNLPNDCSVKDISLKKKQEVLVLRYVLKFYVKIE